MPNYVTKAEVASFLGIDISDSNLDTEVEVTLDVAESVVDQYLNTSYANQDSLVVLLDGNGYSELTLKLPLVSVTSLKILDGEGAEESTYLSTDFRLGPQNPTTGFYRYIKLVNGKFPEGVQNIQLTGNFGFDDESSTHKAFKLAVYYVVKAIFDSKIKGTFDAHIRAGDNTTIYNKESEMSVVPYLARCVLNNYRINTENLTF